MEEVCMSSVEGLGRVSGVPDSAKSSPISSESALAMRAQVVADRALSPLPQSVTRKGTTYYPSFGEKIRGPKPPHWIKVASKVCLIVACCLSVVGAIPLLFYSLWKLSAKYRLKRSLPESMRKQIPPEGTPQVGRYYETRLLVAKTADEGYQWKKKLIHSAETSIELSANYAGGKEFRKILHLIEQRLQEKPSLKAHLLVNPELLEPEDKHMLKELQDRYQGRFLFLIHSPHVHFEGGIHTEENHVKMLVVDEKYFVTGGTSIHPRLASETQGDRSDVKAPRARTARALDLSSRDNDIVGESENISKVMRRQFYSLFQVCEMHVQNKPVEERFVPFEGTKGICDEFQKSPFFERVRMKVIVGGPEHRLDNPITRQYVTRIQKAKESIILANMQFYPHEKIRKALEQKKQTGVPITLLTGGASDTSCIGRCLQVWRSRVQYHLPDSVYEYQVPKQIFHKKIAVFDTRHTVIGSYNLGRKSSLYDHEMICVIKDERVTTAFQEVLIEDKKRSREVRSSILQHHGWHRLFGSLLRPLEQFV